MEVHCLVTLTVSARLDEARAAALNLDSAASLLLDVLHVSATLANDLSTQVESGHWFEINRDSLIRPFALHKISEGILK